MSENLTFYKVSYKRKGYPVTFIDPVTREVNTFTGADEHGNGAGFGDPVEACGEFEACVGGPHSCYLEAAQFAGKVKAFKKLKEQQALWDAMRPLNANKEVAS